MFEKLIEILSKDFPSNLQEVENYARWVNQLVKNPKTWWAKWYDTEVWVAYFKKVANEWMFIDHKHITIQSTWISYDYVAYFNKMLLVYPETKMDTQIVYKWDDFNFTKKDWVVTYTHEFKNPFNKKEDDIIGWYCIIKNRKWEFITLMNREEFDKHRKVARTDYIWQWWYAEMSMKTLVKKAVKVHFNDIYSSIEEEDNKQNDLGKIAKEWMNELVDNIKKW